MKKMKLIRMFFVAVLLVLVLGAFGKSDVQAASKAKFNYKKIDKSKSFDSGRVKGVVYYKKVVLKGNSKAIKKINKAIKKDCNKFLNSASAKSLISYAKEAVNNDYYKNDKIKYYYYAIPKVSYNKKGIISIRVKTFWFAGGVSNTSVYGLNYSLKTGKKLNLTNVCEGTPKQIKQTVLNKIGQDNEAASMDWALLNSYKVKKMAFFLKPEKKAVVCFQPYEISYGGWYRTFTIKSKYK